MFQKKTGIGPHHIKIMLQSLPCTTVMLYNLGWDYFSVEHPYH